MRRRNNHEVKVYILSTMIWSCIVGTLIFLMNLSVHSGEARTLMAFLYMPSPFIATLYLHHWKIKAIITDYGLHPTQIEWRKVLKTSIVFFTSYFILFLGLIVIFGNILHIPGFGHVATSSQEMMGEFIKLVPETAQTRQPEFPPLTQLLIATYVSAIIAGSTINMLFSLGEEIGWRGFLWDKVKHIGFMKANVFIGVIWGLWHAPLILQGYNFPGQPILGVLFMIFFSIALTFPLTDFREKTKTVVTPAIMHGMINASGILMFVVVEKNQFIGGMLGFTGLAAILLAWLLTRKLLYKH